VIFKLIIYARVVHCDYPPRAPQSLRSPLMLRTQSVLFCHNEAARNARCCTPLLSAESCNVPSWQVHVNTNAVHCAGIAGPTASFVIYLCGDEQWEMSFTKFLFLLMPLFQWSDSNTRFHLYCSKSLPMSFHLFYVLLENQVTINTSAAFKQQQLLGNWKCCWSIWLRN